MENPSIVDDSLILHISRSDVSILEKIFLIK